MADGWVWVRIRPKGPRTSDTMYDYRCDWELVRACYADSDTRDATDDNFQIGVYESRWISAVGTIRSSPHHFTQENFEFQLRDEDDGRGIIECLKAARTPSEAIGLAVTLDRMRGL